jgi:hypothetical protein
VVTLGMTEATEAETTVEIGQEVADEVEIAVVALQEGVTGTHITNLFFVVTMQKSSRNAISIGITLLYHDHSNKQISIFEFVIYRSRIKNCNSFSLHPALHLGLYSTAM